MAQNVDAVNRATMPSPYVNSKQQSQNTKELFDLLRPDRMGTAGTGKQEQTEKAGQQLIERLKQQLVSNDSSMVAGNLKKFLDAAAQLNNKAGAQLLNDKDIQQMMLKPENLLKELNSQQKGASVFQGKLFDELRNLLQQGKFSTTEQQAAVKEAVVGLLRQYANLYMKAQRPAEGAEMKSASQNAEGGKEATAQKSESQQGKTQQAAATGVKDTAEAGFKRAEALLYKAIDKLSDVLKEEGTKFEALRTKIDALKPEAARLILNQTLENHELQKLSSMDKMLDVILAKLEESTGNDTIKLYGEQIVRGLLNSNTMNQPILHFVLPLLFDSMSAFAEMWVDPDAENPNGEGKDGKNGKATRVFLTVDLEDKGKAEIDVILANNKIYTNLYYPPEMAEAFGGAREFIAVVTQNAGFAIGEINVEALQDAHLIDEIVGKPIERRMALDAKV